MTEPPVGAGLVATGWFLDAALLVAGTIGITAIVRGRRTGRIERDRAVLFAGVPFALVAAAFSGLSDAFGTTLVVDVAFDAAALVAALTSLGCLLVGGRRRRS